MPWLSAFLLMAQAPVAPPIQVELPVLHRRPSKISGFLNEIDARDGGLHVIIVPNDEASTLTLIGTKADLDEVRKRIALFDNAPAKVRLALRVDSPIDHADWKAEIETSNNLAWTGEDEATGVHLRVSPRLNGDDTCTVYVKAESKDTSPINVVFRIKRGEEQSFTLPPLRKGLPDSKSPHFSLKFAG